MKRPSRPSPGPAAQTSTNAGNAGGPASDTQRTGVAERWLEENREALESYNDYVDRVGLPFARYRQF